MNIFKSKRTKNYNITEENKKDLINAIFFEFGFIITDMRNQIEVLERNTHDMKIQIDTILKIKQ